jgi:hypothetical protein
MAELTTEQKMLNAAKELEQGAHSKMVAAHTSWEKAEAAYQAVCALRWKLESIAEKSAPISEK